jgi:hypothetical protein
VQTVSYLKANTPTTGYINSLQTNRVPKDSQAIPPNEQGERHRRLAGGGEHYELPDKSALADLNWEGSGRLNRPSHFDDERS